MINLIKEITIGETISSFAIFISSLTAIISSYSFKRFKIIPKLGITAGTKDEFIPFSTNFKRNASTFDPSDLTIIFEISYLSKNNIQINEIKVVPDGSTYYEVEHSIKGLLNGKELMMYSGTTEKITYKNVGEILKDNNEWKKAKVYLYTSRGLIKKRLKINNKWILRKSMWDYFKNKIKKI